ncbi:MAG: formyltransferase family protein [Gammaproteobacteria bacterium]|nr:formyltransferase family protein [Gammaproteobacteria bacterium]
MILACSSVLGTEAQSIVRRFFERVDVVSRDCVDESAETAVREVLLRRTFDLAISFYSCFIFRPTELERIPVPLNIHPALPSLPGWCHELLPVLKGHDTVGVTVHWMSETIDSGRIIDVFEYPLPRERTLSRCGDRYTTPILKYSSDSVPIWAGSRMWTH